MKRYSKANIEIKKKQTPKDAWTNKHLLRIYEAIESDHQRIDAVGRASPETTECSTASGTGSEDGSGGTEPTTTDVTPKGSAESSPASVHILYLCG